MKHICTFCNREFKSGSSLGGHKINCKLDPEYSIKRQKINNKISVASKNKKLSEETKRKISESRRKYLLENPDKVPYLLNHNSKVSYPERTMIKYLNENNIKGWVHQMQFSIYEIDFAFPEYKLAVEIDGSTHLLPDVIEKDKRKDLFLNSNGWKVIRITASEVKNNVYDCINIILNNLGEKQIEIPEAFLNKLVLKNLQNKELEDKKIKKQLEKNIRIKNYIEKIQNSNIDFTKFGWVAKVSNLLCLSHTATIRFMKKHMSDFYNGCFKRKSPQI